MTNINLMQLLIIVRNIDGYKSFGKVDAVRAVRKWGFDNKLSIGICDAKKFVESV